MSYRTWDEMYHIAKLYYEENRNLLISSQYLTNDSVNLGAWVSKQRKSYNAKKISNEKIILLEKIGMDWDPLDSQWNEWYNFAKEYYYENGNLFVPYDYTTKNNKKLGSWIGNQRFNYKENKLSQEKSSLLEKIGMSWNTLDSQWAERYILAAKYYRENGNLLIPSNYETNGIKLGIWICTQRNNYKKNKLSEYKVDLLEKIGMLWDSFKSQWNEYYDLAIEYYSEKKDLLVPIYYKTKSGKQLGSWISHQRRNYLNGKLAKENINLLNKIGMVWEPLDSQWKEYYNSAKKFYKENGNLLIPLNYITNDNKLLGSWISVQRKKL